jgi:hypothetical protein
MFARITPGGRGLFMAVAGAKDRQQLRRIGFAVAATTKREVDDDNLLLQIERRRRHQPSLTVAAAVERVVSDLPVGDPDRSGGQQVKVGSTWVSKSSVLERLQRKYRKHREEIQLRVDGEKYGRAVAQRFLPPLLDPRTRLALVRSPFDRAALGEGPVYVRKEPLRSLDPQALPDAVDAFLREMRDLARRARSG